MKKNYIISFKISKEDLDLINKTLSKLSAETNIQISKSDFCRVSLKRVCLELVSNEIKSSELLFKN